MSAAIATIFGIGYLRPAPGTWGSLFALVLAILLLESFGIIGFAIALLSACVLGWWATSEYLKRTSNKDPSEVVIDELIGLWIAVLPIAWAVFFLQPTLVRLMAGMDIFIFLFSHI